MKKLIGEWSRLIIGIVTVVLAIITIGCNSSKGNNNALLALLGLISPPPAASYTVTYDDNVSTSGSVPTDSNTYTAGATVIILGNTGLSQKQDLPLLDGTPKLMGAEQPILKVNTAPWAQRI